MPLEILLLLLFKVCCCCCCSDKCVDTGEDDNTAAVGGGGGGVACRCSGSLCDTVVVGGDDDSVDSCCSEDTGCVDEETASANGLASRISSKWLPSVVPSRLSILSSVCSKVNHQKVVGHACLLSFHFQAYQVISSTNA